MSGKLKSLAKIFAPLMLLSALFAGSVTPANADTVPTIRMVGLDASTAFDRSGDAAEWVGLGYYHDGLRAFTKQLPVGSTTTITYAVTGVPTGTTVNLHLNKAWSGSTAKISVGDTVANGLPYVDCGGWWGQCADAAVVSGVTDSNGNVSFELKNNDVAADAADYPSSANANYTGTHLYSQITADIGADNADIKDIVDLVFYKPSTVVPPTGFSGHATVRLAGMDATNSVNLPDVAGEWVGLGYARDGVTYHTKLVPVGSTQHLTFVVSDSATGTPVANKTVTFVMGKAWSGSNAHVSVGPNAASGADCWCGNAQATATGTTDAQGLVSFDVVNTDVASAAADYPGTNLAVAPAGSHLFTQVAAWVTGVLDDSVDIVDLNYFKPGAAPVTPQVVSRINGITADNAAVGSAEGWAQYYADGLRYFERGVEVGTTTRLSYTVTSGGSPYANKTVHLLLGKTYSGSTAKVSVNGQAFTGAQVIVDLTTDANGVVTFDVANTNVTADADPYQAANLLHPKDGKHLFAQLALVGEKGNGDVLDMLDLVYYRSQAAVPPTVLNVRLADWNATNSFDGTHVWGDGGLGNWFDATTNYYAHYVKVGSTFNLKYSVKNSAGVAAPDGTVVTLALGTAWSGSNAKFRVNGVAVSGVTKWGANGQEDQATTTATVSGGFITVSVTSLDIADNGTVNPGSATANPDDFSPLFMQIKAHVEGNFTTQQDWVNIVATKAASAPTITSISGTSGKNGQAIDIVGTNLGDALGGSVSLNTAAVMKGAVVTTPAVTTPVSVIAVSADGTRMTVRSPNKAQKGYLSVTTTGGTATSATLFSSSTSNTSKPAIVLAASVTKEIGSTLTLTGANLGSATAVKVGTVNASFTVVNANSITVTIPADAVSGSTISATNAGGTVTTSKLVFQAPVLVTATASGTVGSTVTVTGKNLKATAILFGGNKTAKAVINTGTSLTFLVPMGATTGAIKITTGGGFVNTASFTVLPYAPTVTSFTPATGKKGVAIVTVKGKYLTGATVTVGSVAVTLSAGASDTSFKFVIPAGASTGKINVTTAGGSVSSATNLTVTN